MRLETCFGLCSGKNRKTQKSETLVEEDAALRTVYCGTTVDIDIVVIHGLNGHAKKSFTSKNQKFWLGDEDMLRQDLPNSRIMTFSYPANVATIFGTTSSDTILQHATTFAQELAADRSVNGATQRPLIFICHSLGGIIAKRALTYAESRKDKKMEHVHALFVSTYGLLFFGTPHDGSSKAVLASYAQRMIASLVPSKVIDTDSQLVNALQERSEILREVTANFQPLMGRFHIFFFWEQLKTDLGTRYDYIVTEASAAPILDGTDRAAIRAEHRHMCKFASRTSPGYPLVAATLIRYLRDAPNVVARRWDDTAHVMRIREQDEIEEEVVSSKEWAM